MANNPYVNKVQKADGTTIIDISDTTAVASDVASGKYFYAASGEKVAGTSSGGGGITPVPAKDVNFIDYDGTIVYSYTKAEFANLSALPANPTHDGLTAQGWNWMLAEAKTYVAAYGKLWIGQQYITSDGKTRIYIHLEEGRLSPTLGIAVNGTATVEWGDGSTSTVTGTSTTTVVNTQHTYPAGGDYVIAISVSGSMAFVGSSSYGSQVLWKNSTTGNQNRVYQNAIQKVEIGTNTSIDAYAFYNCYSLASITIPSSVTSIGAQAFMYCYSLASITIPSGATSIGTSAFYICYSLASITLPNEVTNINSNTFYNCYSLASITIPSSVTSIGASAFYNCYSLASITIPSEVTSIGAQAFYNCYGLGEIHLKPTMPPTASNRNAWTNIPTDCIIYVPYSADHSILAAYTSANNYPSSSTYTYREE